MTTLREAAQQALEACEQRLPLKGQAAIIDELNNLRAALAESVQEQQLRDDAARWKNIRGYVEEMEREIQALRAALAEPVQEPVAWMYDCGGGGRMYAEELDDVPGWAPLYTAPPQRKPLTDEEMMDEFCKTPGIHQFVSAFFAGARYAERAHGIGDNT